MASKTEQLHFLLVPLMSQSHIIPLTDFAKLLAQRGMFVSIVTTPLNSIRYKPVFDQAIAQNLKIRTVSIDFPSEEAGLPKGCENMDSLNSLELSKQFFIACELLQRPLEIAIQEMDPKPDCIISTNALPWTQKVAEKFKIPRYIFETVSCFTLFCSGKISKSVMEKSDTFLVPDIPHKIEFTKAQLPNPSSDGQDDSRNLVNQMKEVQDLALGTLVNTFEELEPWFVEGLKKKRGNVWCIGPVSLCNTEISERSCRGDKASIDEHYCIKWLDSKNPRSTIYACFGSLCCVSIAQMQEIGLGLEESGFPFIWVIKKNKDSAEIQNWLAEERFEEKVRGRGLVIHGWAPQVLILSHPSVGGFLTHCGWNSTLEGVCAGVPMITWPMFAEQFYNDKFVVDVLGIGVRVGVDACVAYGVEDKLVKRDRIKKVIESLMSDGREGIRRRTRVGELANMARRAIEGGSSYANITMLIEDVTQQVL